MTLTAPAPARTPAAPTTAKAARRGARRESRRGVGHRRRVPALDRTLQAMNAAQSVFGFELVDMSAPLDVWDVNKTEGTNFLRAEQLARRLQGKPVELGVDILACITRHWLRDEDWLYLYGWWPDGRKPPVVIFSVAGFDQLPAEGPDTDRAIANAAVTCLAGFYGDLDTHARGAKDCPLAFNRSRDYKHLMGPQKFDANCRRKLSKALGAKLGALEALLRVFSA